MVQISNSVEGKYNAGLSIGGLELLPSQFLTPVIEVRIGLHRALPSLTLEIDDKNAEVTEALGGISDGMIVEVALNDGKGGVQFNGEFTLMGGPKVSLKKTGLYIKAQGVLNKLGWLRQVVDFHLPDAPASAMVSALAGIAGLKTDIDASAGDVMTWLPNRKPLIQYAEMVSQRSSGGASVFGVSGDGTLKFKKLSSLLGGGGGVTVGGKIFDANSGQFPYLDWSAESTGMMNNAAAGWGMTTLGENITGEKFEFDKIAASLFGDLGSIGKGIQDAIGQFGTRIQSMGVDSGNVHDKYYESAHSNKREKAAWSNNVSALLDHSTGLDLFDSFNFKPLKPITGDEMTAYSGQYAVTNKVLSFRNGFFLEKVTGTNSSQ